MPCWVPHRRRIEGRRAVQWLERRQAWSGRVDEAGRLVVMRREGGGTCGGVSTPTGRFACCPRAHVAAGGDQGHSRTARDGDGRDWNTRLNGLVLRVRADKENLMVCSTLSPCRTAPHERAAAAHPVHPPDCTLRSLSTVRDDLLLALRACSTGAPLVELARPERWRRGGQQLEGCDASRAYRDSSHASVQASTVLPRTDIG